MGQARAVGEPAEPDARRAVLTRALRGYAFISRERRSPDGGARPRCASLRGEAAARRRPPRAPLLRLRRLRLRLPPSPPAAAGAPPRDARDLGGVRGRQRHALQPRQDRGDVPASGGGGRQHGVPAGLPRGQGVVPFRDRGRGAVRRLLFPGEGLPPAPGDRHGARAGDAAPRMGERVQGLGRTGRKDDTGAREGGDDPRPVGEIDTRLPPARAPRRRLLARSGRPGRAQAPPARCAGAAGAIPGPRRHPPRLRAVPVRREGEDGFRLRVRKRGGVQESRRRLPRVGVRRRRGRAGTGGGGTR